MKVRARLSATLWVLAALTLAASLGVGPALASHGSSEPPAVAGAVTPSAGGTPGLEWTTFHGSENRSGDSSVDGPTRDLVAWTSCLTRQHLRAGPVSDGSHIFVGGDLGTIYAINNSVEGPLIWNVTLPSPPTQMDLAGGTLFVPTTLGSLYALDAATGAIDWRVYLGSGIVQDVAVDGGNVFVPLASGFLQTYSAATGSAEWQVALPGPAGGAPAVDSGVVYVATTGGSVVALTESGAILWTSSVGAGVGTAPAVGGGRVIVADVSGGVTALAVSNGTQLWHWQTPDRLGDSLHATRALGATALYIETDNGQTGAINVTDGRLLWMTSGTYSPYPTTAAPVIAPNGLYAVVNGIDSVVEFDPSNGSVVWYGDILTNSFGSPALLNGQILIGADIGCVYDFGPGGPPYRWNVTGTVTDANGTPLDRVLVHAGTDSYLTGSNGSFALQLPNGSWAITAQDSGFYPYNGSVRVQGTNVLAPIVLHPLYFYALTGRVVDGFSGYPVANATVDLAGPYGYVESVRSADDGSFRLAAPNGTIDLATEPEHGYAAASTVVRVAGGPLANVVLRPAPSGGSVTDLNPDAIEVWFPLVAVAIALAVVAARELSRRRVAVGLPPALLSPFGQYVTMRLLLIPVQILVLLSILYFVGNVVNNTTACLPHDYACVTTSYFSGLLEFFKLLFTGQWGYLSYGNLREPTTTLLGWWIPNSIELAAVALPLSVAIAYPLGLLSGWKPGSATDEASRLTSIVILMIPTMVVALLLFAVLDQPFYAYFGDLPDGLTPSGSWFANHGGFPSWWTFTGTSTPTGFPVVDGALHGDWSFERLILVKLFVQAAAIAFVYVAVFLRHARNTTAEVVRELHLTAARARGVSERTLLWRHTRRRVLPVYFLIFSLTVPAYLGTQAVVEVLFNDTGFGTLLFYEVTNIGGHPIGFSGPLSGNFYQVALLLLLLVILFSILSSDIVGRYLDPRTRRPE